MRPGFDVKSLRVLVMRHCLAYSLSLPTNGLTFVVRTALVMLHLTFLTATDMHVTLELIGEHLTNS